MRAFPGRLLLITVVIAAAAPLLAGVNQWTPAGPHASDGSSVVVHALVSVAGTATLYAAADQGVFRSDDAGASWSALNTGLPPGKGFLAIAVDLSNASRIWGGAGTGIYVTEDGGANWTSAGLADQTVGAVVVDPNDPATVYAAATPTIQATGTMQRTTDRGAHWETVFTTPDLFDRVLALAVDPSDSNRILVGTQQDLGGPISLSDDHGATWTNWDVFAGSTDSIVFDPLDPSRVLAAYLAQGAPPELPVGSGVFESGDGGTSFSFMNLPASDVDGLVSDPLTGDSYVEGSGYLWRNLHGSSTWSVLSVGHLPLLVTHAAGGDPTVYGTSDQGLMAITLSAAGPCTPTSTNLCLLEGRFQVAVDWQAAPEGPSRSASAIPLTSDSGYFWFFSADNAELAVKVLDGTAVNGNFWVFYGSLSDVAFTITVTDMATGLSKQYVNAAGILESHADTQAFSAIPPPAGFAPVATASSAAVALAASGCDSDPTTLCLNVGRFQVRTSWQQTPSGPSMLAEGTILQGGNSGDFWFFDPSNVELLVKVLDGRAVNGHFWVFVAGLSNVEWEVQVTDTQTRETRTYANSSGQLQSLADTTAF